MQMSLQVPQIKVQKGLRLIMIRRISLVRKPVAAIKSPAKKPTARTVKAKTPAPVVTLKHIAAEIAEAHEVPKTRAETMLVDTVDRERVDFIQKYFHVEWPDRPIYHTMINTAIGDEAVVHMVLDLMKTLEARVTASGS